MHLQSEQPEKHAIQSYTQDQVYIDNQCYMHSVLVSKNEIHTFPALHTLQELDPKTCLRPLTQQPEIFLIGYPGQTQFLSASQYLGFTQNGIGVECMKFDAACRTFNILLGEQRRVCLLLML